MFSRWKRIADLERSVEELWLETARLNSELRRMTPPLPFPTRKKKVWMAPICAAAHFDMNARCWTHTKHTTGLCVRHRGLQSSANSDNQGLL